MEEVKIKKATREDLRFILKTYEDARKYMKEHGNPSQWGDDYPSLNLIKELMYNQDLYVGIYNRQLAFVFAFIIGEDPTYNYIEGKWGSYEIYGTLHMVASSQIIKDTFSYILDFAKSKINYIRIDTHEDNKKMQQVIENHNFKKRGIIYTRDNTPRIAYDLIVTK